MIQIFMKLSVSCWSQTERIFLRKWKTKNLLGQRSAAPWGERWENVLLQIFQKVLGYGALPNAGLFVITDQHVEIGLETRECSSTRN